LGHQVPSVHDGFALGAILGDGEVRPKGFFGALGVVILHGEHLSNLPRLDKIKGSETVNLSLIDRIGSIPLKKSQGKAEPELSRPLVIDNKGDNDNERKAKAMDRSHTEELLRAA
jgi:hypothetical protein